MKMNSRIDAMNKQTNTFGFNDYFINEEQEIIEI